MNCPKCGEKVTQPDEHCAACGHILKKSGEKPAPEKKDRRFNIWIFLILAAAMLVPYMTGQKTDAGKASAPAQGNSGENYTVYSGSELCAPELNTAALREEKGESPEGALSFYYRQDDSLAAEKLVYAEDAARLTHYDVFGNPLAVFEYDGIAGVYLEYYYENTYDSQNRLCRQVQTNKRGAVAMEQTWHYQPDGTCAGEVTEYRGAWVYTWDYEAHGADNPIKFYHARITYDAAGQEVSREETLLD